MNLVTSSVGMGVEEDREVDNVLYLFQVVFGQGAVGSERLPWVTFHQVYGRQLTTVTSPWFQWFSFW